LSQISLILIQNSIGSGENFSAMLSKPHSRRPEQSFDFFPEKINFFLKKSEVEQKKVFCFSSENLGKFFRTEFYVFRVTS